MSDPKVWVLGCGPSGLVAAEAAWAMGYQVRILSKKRPSHLWGCQYLHAPIPSVTPLEPVTVRYQLDGSKEGYAAKVYGPEYRGTVSPEDFEGEHQAWDLRETYRRLWERWERAIIEAVFTNGNMAAEVLPDFLKKDIVFNTMPRRLLCNNPRHSFHSQEIWAMGDSDEQQCPIRPNGENMVVCNGNENPAWYRVSRVLGYTTCEWPWRDGKKPPFDGVAMVEKPIYTDCSCLPEVHYVGRYGAWRKGVLVHHVWEDVTKALTNVQERLF